MFIQVSIELFDIFHLYCVGLPGYTRQYGLKNADNKLQKLQDKKMTLLLEKFIKGGISSVMGEKYVVLDDN